MNSNYCILFVNYFLDDIPQLETESHEHQPNFINFKSDRSVFHSQSNESIVLSNSPTCSHTTHTLKRQIVGMPNFKLLNPYGYYHN